MGKRKWVCSRGSRAGINFLITQGCKSSLVFQVKYQRMPIHDLTAVLPVEGESILLNIFLWLLALHSLQSYCDCIYHCKTHMRRDGSFLRKSLRAHRYVQLGMLPSDHRAIFSSTNIKHCTGGSKIINM